MISLEDFSIHTHRKRGRIATHRSDRNCGEGFTFLPRLEADVFGFEILIHKVVTAVSVGIEGSKGEFSTALEDILQWFIKFGRTNFCFVFDKKIRKFRGNLNHILPHKIGDGDRISVIVDKINGKLSCQVNGGEWIVVLNKLLGCPKKLCIFMGLYGKGDCGELVRFEEYPVISERVSKIDIEERIDFLCSNDNSILEKVNIPLKNRNIEIWKPFLLSSRVPVLDSDFSNIFNELSELSLNIEEKIIFKLLHDELDIPLSKEDLGDYYLFFRGLHLKKQMGVLLQQISEIESFQTCFELFKSTVKDHENEEIKGWFEGNKSSDLTESSFDNAFTLRLFTHLKELESQFETNFDLFALEQVGIIMLHLKKFASKLNPFNHQDFESLTDRRNKILMERLRNGTLSNVILRCSDDEELFAHREILIYKSNFFFRMLRFGGAETEQLLSDGRINLENIDSRTCSNILDFHYYGRFEEEIAISGLIKILVHSHMFDEKEMFSLGLNQLLYSKNPGNLEEIILRDFGYMLYENDELKKFIIPRIMKIDPKIKKEKMNNLLRKSFKDHRIRDIQEKMNQMNKRMEKENKELKKELKEVKEEQRKDKEELKRLKEDIESIRIMKKEIKELFDMVKPTKGVGEKRKRSNRDNNDENDENDDEEKEREEETPKKKRKLE